MRLIDAVAQSAPANPVYVRTGTISAITGTTCTVSLAGASLTTVPRLTSYTPTVGHVVILLQSGSQLVILGKVA